MPKLVIHAGFPKSGTTSLQAVFRENADFLVSHEILYPESGRDAHHTAVAALVGRSIGWGLTKRDTSLWNNFVKDLLSANAETILISSEFFTAASPDLITKIKNDLSEFEIQIFFTIRSLEKIVPSIYQQNLKKGSTIGYPQWLSNKFLTTDGDLRKVPRLINHAKVLKTWVEVFGSENVSLIVADSSNPEFLFRATEELLGIGKLVPVKDRALNRSLTKRECEILRLINIETANKWQWNEYKKIVRQGWVKSLSGTVADDLGGKFELPNFLKPVVADFARKQIATIKRLQVQVLGDLESFANTTDLDVSNSSQNLDEIMKEFNLVMNSLSRQRKLNWIKPATLIKKITTRMF